MLDSKFMYEKNNESNEKYPNHRNNPVGSKTFNNFYKSMNDKRHESNEDKFNFSNNLPDTKSIYEKKYEAADKIFNPRQDPIEP